MTLNGWQERLAKHFADLKEERLRSARSSHIFALEHGLDNEELASLEKAIGEFCTQSAPASRHWLAWAVYASEIGYSYSGDEYWQTFSERTPGWDKHNQMVVRDSIREAFYRFRKDCAGATPTGRWAGHFTIICWPITHAILPQDLQRQLAEILFDIRHEFDQHLLSSAELLGHRIEVASWKASSRFQQFAEQHLLVGQIASALLLSEEERESSVVLPATLKRIAGDLDRERRAREWLSDARREAFTVKIRGLGRPGATTRDHESDDFPNSPRQQLLRLGIEPSLSLRQVGKAEWEVRLQLPSFAPLLGKFPQFRAVLAGERCAVAGARDKRPMARERLLFGTQEVVLAQWPAKGQILLRFEKSSPEMDYLLHTECLLRPGPQWLFKVAEDGTASEIKTATIRPGAEYILLSEDEMLFYSLDFERVIISCTGIHGSLLRIPAVVTHKVTSELENLGLSTASSLSAWPIGLPPAKWDDEGNAEYLTTDSPCVAVSNDFQNDGMFINLVGSMPSQLPLPGGSGAAPVLVELGRLPSGSHELHVITSHNQHPVTATLHITVREPLPASTPSAVMSVTMAPSNARLEQFWDGTATVEIYAPEDSKISCELNFYSDVSCSKKTFARQFGPLAAPVSQSAFSSAFASVKAQSSVQNAYDEAACCVLRAWSTQLGEHSLRCEREPSPCRWAVKRENHAYWLRLIQADQLATPKFFTSSFVKPDAVMAVPAALFDSRYRVPDEGGLFTAATDTTSCTVVIPPLIRSLQDLRVRISSGQQIKGEGTLGQIIRSIELWSAARIVGDPISASRKQDVLTYLTGWLVSTLCGDQWSRCENTVDGVSGKRRALLKCSDMGRHPGLVYSMSKMGGELSSLPLSQAADILTRLFKSNVSSSIFSLAQDHGMSSLQWLTEFALRLFTEPERTRLWAGQDFTSGLHYLVSQRGLAQVCRYTSLSRESAIVGSTEGTHP